jgi:hypothetical protein
MEENFDFPNYLYTPVKEGFIERYGDTRGTEISGIHNYQVLLW